MRVKEAHLNVSKALQQPTESISSDYERLGCETSAESGRSRQAHVIATWKLVTDCEYANGSTYLLDANTSCLGQTLYLYHSRIWLT